MKTPSGADREIPARSAGFHLPLPEGYLCTLFPARKQMGQAYTIHNNIFFSIRLMIFLKSLSSFIFRAIRLDAWVTPD
jgi:hypothetical protein